MSEPINNIVRKTIEKSNPKYGIIDLSFHNNPIIAAGTTITSGEGLYTDIQKKLNFQVVVYHKIGYYQGNDGDYKHRHRVGARGLRGIEEDTTRYTGNINAYFDPNIWDDSINDVIYLDPVFKTGVARALKKSGFKYFNLFDYSEYGMQNYDFVNFDLNSILAEEILKAGYAEGNDWDAE